MRRICSLVLAALLVSVPLALIGVGLARRNLAWLASDTAGFESHLRHTYHPDVLSHLVLWAVGVGGLVAVVEVLGLLIESILPRARASHPTVSQGT